MASTNTSDWSTDSRDETEPFPLSSHDILHSNSTAYLAYELSGEGCYGKVARCIDLNTGDKVAVKILSECGYGDLEGELNAYKALRALDPDKHNIVRFIENFELDDHSCLAFEMLDQSLWEVVDENGWCYNEIRPVTHQMLVALKALADIGLFHTDLKPDNIMLVNHWEQPFRVKLIDFGLAAPVNQVEVGTLMQPYGFRAPEVILGLPLSEAIDMWGLGCTLAYLYLGRPIFPTNSSYYAMREMVHLLGPPEEHLLLDGMYTCSYLIREPRPSSPRGWIWRFKRRREYEQAEGIKLKRCRWPKVPSLEQAVQKSSGDNSEHHDGMQFVDLLKSCLQWDAAKRITPSEALKHSFVTMAHLDQKEVTSSYRRAAHQLMTVCPMEPSDDGLSDATGSTDGDAASISSTDEIVSPTAAITDSTDADCAPAVSNTNDDGASAAAGSTDGDAASISSTDEIVSPTAAITDSTDADCAPAVSDTNDDGASAAAGSTDGDAASISSTDEIVSPAAAITDSTDADCAPAVSDTNDNGASAAPGSNDGTAATAKVESAVATDNDSADTDCVATVSNSNDDRPAAAAGSTDGATAIIPVDTHGLTKKKKKNLFQRTLKFFHRVRSRAEITSHEIPTGSPETTNLRDGLRDTAAPAEEESAAATSDDSADTDCVATVSNSNDDRPAAAAASTDGAAASISSTDGVTAITPVNTHGLTKKKKKNLFQRTLKFFRRVRSRAEITSHENPTGSSVTSNLCDCEADTATPTEEVSAAATNKDSADCLPTVSNSNDYSVSLATVTSDGAAASMSLNDGAVAVMISADADGLKKKRKKKNLVQRFFTCFG